MPNQHDTRWTPELIDAMATACAERGARTLAEVGRDFGATESAARHVLARAGKLATTGKTAPLSEHERAEIERLWPTTSTCAIAKRLGRHEKTVANLAKAMGLPARTLPGPDLDAIRADILARVPREDILRTHKIGAPRWAVIRDGLIADGLLPPKVDAQARNAEIARRLHAGETTRAVCGALGVKRNVVWAVAKKEGIETTRPEPKRAYRGPAKIVLGPGMSSTPTRPVYIQPEPTPANAKPLEQLTDHDCHWPYGERHHIRYCAAALANPHDYGLNGLYCAHHKLWAQASTIGSVRQQPARAA